MEITVNILSTYASFGNVAFHLADKYKTERYLRIEMLKVFEFHNISSSD